MLKVGKKKTKKNVTESKRKDKIWVNSLGIWKFVTYASMFLFLLLVYCLWFCFVVFVLLYSLCCLFVLFCCLLVVHTLPLLCIYSLFFFPSASVNTHSLEFMLLRSLESADSGPGDSPRVLWFVAGAPETL